MSEQTSISELASDESIIIKQADKGGATVIMDKQFYQEHIDKMLQNNEYYKQLEENPHKEIMKIYRTLMKQHETELTKKEFDYGYLTNFECI